MRSSTGIITARWTRLTASVLTVLALSASDALAAHPHYGWFPGPPGTPLWTHSDPGEPPSRILDWLELQLLVNDYFLLHTGIPFSFEQWLILNDVKDPHARALAIRLYWLRLRQLEA